MAASTHQNTQADILGTTPEAQKQPAVPCGWACTRLEHSIQTTKKVCEHGLSELQIHVLATILELGNRIISYEHLGKILTTKIHTLVSGESVRGVVQRLAKRGYLQHQQAREGLRRGVRFKVPHSKACLLLAHAVNKEFTQHTQADIQAGIQDHAIDRDLSVYLTSKGVTNTTRQYLESLTEQAIELHWPELFKQGLRMSQIRQIIANLDKVGIACTDVLQGLTHAEWALANGGLRDKFGKAVELPLNWVFKTLSRQGYYPRPAGYISPEEQAELDATEEKKRLAAAHKARYKAEFDAWDSLLSREERKSIINASNNTNGSRLRLPEHIQLSKYFELNIWPDLQRQKE